MENQRGQQSANGNGNDNESSNILDVVTPKIPIRFVRYKVKDERSHPHVVAYYRSFAAKCRMFGSDSNGLRTYQKERTKNGYRKKRSRKKQHGKKR